MDQERLTVLPTEEQRMNMCQNSKVDLENVRQRLRESFVKSPEFGAHRLSLAQTKMKKGTHWIFFRRTNAIPCKRRLGCTNDLTLLDTYPGSVAHTTPARQVTGTYMRDCMPWRLTPATTHGERTHVTDHRRLHCFSSLLPSLHSTTTV